MLRNTLGIFEYELLSILLQEPNGSYGAKMLNQIEELTRRSISVGAIYTSLDRLEAKGFVSSWWGEPTLERGGRRKRFYKIEGSGVKALERSEAEMLRFMRVGALAGVKA
jgi:PadR family transcriptional regulator, regulatory protein PadR